ncbi:MAG TPA: hypothetical protein DCE42_23805 [Myxococcales bacterium]|nr:hypothetical protein [Deltaproteobacteria bacterium]MBU48619.1 hypothetical protein [Deltaproteobacteria bacterium]HAA57812.1 hypothetical protein [Myxococcales bacterium]|tara:strand:- start:4493 stop:5689 length:1197 start_codon:yes stop_codon:yes gene_type:complete
MKRSKGSVLVVGGAYRTLQGTHYVQKRHWGMLRLFIDHFEDPLLLHESRPTDETLRHPIPDTTRIQTIAPMAGVRQKLRTLFLRGHGLTKEIKAAVEDSDVVYLRLPWQPCLPIFEYARSKGKKIITSFHGDWASTYRNKQNTGLNTHLNNMYARYIDAYQRRIAGHSAICFFVGQALYDLYGTPGRPHAIFANFLHEDADILTTPPPPRQTGPYNVLFVGDLSQRKGVPYLLDAFRQSRQAGQDLHLHFIGEGALKQKIVSFAEKHALTHALTLHGYVQHGAALHTLYRAADVLVLPSVSGEGVPKVLMEAMTQGVPVISTDIGSSRHLLQDGEYGMVVPPANAAALSQALNHLLHHPQLRARYIEKGLELARRSTHTHQKARLRDTLLTHLPDIVR